MYNENGYGGIPDELPQGYGYADAQPATVHTNAPTAKTLFEPEAQYQAPPTPHVQSVHASQPNQRPAPFSPNQGHAARTSHQAAQPRQAPPQAQATAPRARPVGPRPFQASGLHTTPSNVTNMRARPTESQIEPGIPSLGDGMSLGSDYGLTSEEREAKKQQREAEHAAKSDKKAAHKALKDSDKAKLRAWQQAAQLGLRFDPARGKWYREVKISGALPQPAPASKKTPLLALGAKGADVKRAQKLLNESGFACGNDGVFSESMKKQVMNFQKSEGLRVDGKIGKETWEALDNDMAAPASSSTGQVVRQYQDGAVAIMKGTLPPGAAHGAVLSPSKFGPTVAAIKADVDENYDVFPLPDLTPPPANWDFKLGKMKPGFTLDVDKLSSTLKTVAGRFQPSGKAAQASETFEMAETEVPADSSKKWMIAGGITVALLVTGGLYLAFRKEPENVAKTPKPSQSTEAE